MFEYIKGSVEYISEDGIIVENNNIGYRIITSSFVANRVKLHEQTCIFTYMHIREDDLSLYGFLSRDEVKVFKLLISVSGIGPKGAIAIMSALSIDELRMAVLSDDHKAIAKANGVGTKTAQRVIMELKDKFKLEDVFDDMSLSDDLPETLSNDNISETVMALVSLGYSNVDALRAVRKVANHDTLTVEELLKETLKNLI